VWLALALIAFAPRTIVAQAPPASKAEKPPAEEAKPEVNDVGDDAKPSSEVFVDPNAKKALSIFSPLNLSPGGQAIKIGNPPDDRSKVQSMASRETNTDPTFLKRFVDYFAVELSKRDNLNAILNPSANMKPNRALEQAVDALIKPLEAARANNNADFERVYARTLFESSLPKLLDNNYLSRIDAMIVLGMAGSTLPNALDLYTNQIKKPDQVVWVKLWAARGLTNATQHGKIDLEASKAARAVEAIVQLLEEDPKIPWPAQMRALQALGSLRHSVVNSPKAKVDVASLVMRLLADPESKAEVRAWAAWALGMMKVSNAVAPYNYTLIGHEIGNLAAELGKQIVEEYDRAPANFDKEKDQAAHLTSLLLFQVYPAIIGEEGVRDSGLNHSPHPNAGAAGPFLKKLDDKVKAVTRGAYELLRAGGVGNLARRNELDVKVTDLKSFLAQNLPKDRHLVPGGPEFELNPAQQVAGAPGR
jgi:hypothetical protein